MDQISFYDADRRCRVCGCVDEHNQLCPVPNSEEAMEIVADWMIAEGRRRTAVRNIIQRGALGKYAYLMEAETAPLGDNG